MPVDSNTALKDQTRTKIPRRYKVIFYNDDFTTMDFVIYVLKNIFGKSGEEAYKLMMTVHKSDCAVVGVYTRDIAYTKVNKAMELARNEGYPFKAEAIAE